MNTLRSFLVNNTLCNRNKLIEAGVYKINCSDCNSVYIGQTGRSINIRFKKLVRS